MSVTVWWKASGCSRASASGLGLLLRARWLRYSLWLLLVSLPLLLSASQPLTPEDLKLVQRAEETYGVRAGKRVTSWRTLVMQNRAAGLNERQKLEKVNHFFNRMRFLDDIKLWRKKDYWATPLEFLGAAGGDCEDFSISKYFTLLELGIPDEKMRMVYVKALDYNQFHMVVAYYDTPSSEPVILDNLIGSIRPASQRRDLVPIYSFNGSHLWLMKARGQGELAGQSSRLGLWTDLRNRMTSGRLARPVVNLDD
ncbi:transglutaminase-like cysteine peptidase [Aeromonas salmonicida]|uniref:Transglutaminase-like cysteine peptidase n=1 Tax=Aeromonas salmonicida TaxID=645 RepID=A0AAX3VSJ7_AERSA|nr:transglutaminase-like cysteine peptidase [Aeromonas salmonicida]WHF36921.1 transglutaminase-like cysteine peptidase [Aeromonas salmonicida]